MFQESGSNCVVVILWAGDDFENTASLVEAVLSLQEQRDRPLLADIVPMQTSALPRAPLMESAAAETAAEPWRTEIGNDSHADAHSSSSSAGFLADVNG